MNRFPIFILILLISASFSTISAQNERKLKQVLTLQMPGEDGSNGASVVWSPVQNKYYAAFAGNADFPLAVFSAAGKLLSDELLTTGVDVRGMWYDSNKGAVCGNAYDEGGWFMLKLDNKGMPSSTETVISGMMQPEKNSVGALENEKEIVFLKGQEAIIYSAKDAKIGNSYRIYAGQTTKPKLSKTEDAEAKENMPEDYNYNVLLCTQQKKAEFGLLNISLRQIELYNKKTGLLTETLALPDSAPVLNQAFNFAFANGIYWLFDKDSRQWIGYK